MDEAIAQLEQALKLAPDNPQIQDDLRRVRKSIAASSVLDHELRKT